MPEVMSNQFVTVEVTEEYDDEGNVQIVVAIIQKDETARLEVVDNYGHTVSRFISDTQDGKWESARWIPEW